MRSGLTKVLIKAKLQASNGPQSSGQVLRLTLSLWVMIALMTIFLASVASAQIEAGQTYIVQHDDTLWKIAEKYLGHGNRFAEIVTATQLKYAEDPTFALITNPSLILSGSKLWIPDLSPAIETSAEVVAPPVVTEEITPAMPTVLQPSMATPAGQIAFSFWNDAPNRCTYEINILDVSACLRDSQLCQARRRVFGLNNASEPALSPAGDYLAFRGWGDIPQKHVDNKAKHPYFNCPNPSSAQADRRLGHTTLDGTDYVSNGAFYEDSHPDWSPDGRRLLFDTGRLGDGITRIMAISADGTFEEDLRIAGQQPSWAADSQRFVYRGCDSSGNRCGLWLAAALPVRAWDVGVNVIGPVLAEAEAAHPDWSPVADKIVYQSAVNGGWDLYTIAADGHNRQQLTYQLGVEGLPTWSPDGEWIAYLANADGNWGIWLIRADGGEQQLLFSFDGGIFTPLAVTPYFTRDWLDEQISWSR